MNEDIIKMVEQGLSVNQISEILKISPKQLYIKLNMLKFKGYLFKNNYYSNGENILTFSNSLNEVNKSNVIFTEKNKDFNLVIISDTHFGSKLDDLNLINSVYNFAIKNNINIILHAGDFVEGPNDLNRFKTFDEQIEFVMKNYPFDKNILNFLCLGNHDIHSNVVTKQDLSTIIKSRRGDIIPIGIGLGKVEIKRDKIVLLHDLENYGTIDSNINNKINVYGHSHKYKVTNKTNGLNVRVPSLSNMPTGTCFPSFLKFNISFNNGYFGSIVIEQYAVLDKVLKIGEINYTFDPNKMRNDESIPFEYNIEGFTGRTYSKVEQKSAIDKFNARWNR